MTTDYVGLTVTFQCTNGHPNVWKTSVYPQRGSSSFLRLLKEQEAFKQAFAAKYTCPCNAFIEGEPKITYQEFPDLQSLRAAGFS
jgi:hypothetical protein